MRAFRLFCGAAIYMLSLALPALAAQPIGNIVAIQPGVSVERAGARTALALKDTIYLQDTIRTDAAGKVHILFSDDSTVALAPQTVFAVQEYADAGGNSRFRGNLGTGLARFITGKVVENNPDAYSVTTPEVNIGIRGTTFAVNTIKGSTTTYVLDATRNVVTVNGISVPNNHSLIVPGTGIPKPISPEQRRTITGHTDVATGTGTAPQQRPTPNPMLDRGMPQLPPPVPPMPAHTPKHQPMSPGGWHR